MTRRGANEGSIYRRTDGLWAAAVELPSFDGKRRRKVVSNKQKAVVIRRLAELRKQLETTGDLPTTTLTVTGWCDHWMREIGIKTRRPKTIASYKSIIDGWVKPVIGGTRLDKLTPQTVRKVLTHMDNAGRSSTYQRNAHSVMAAIFADAEREGRIPRNPVELVVAPRKAVTHLEALTPTETVKFLNALGDSPDAYLWATYLFTGARRGEALGLEWDRLISYTDTNPDTGETEQRWMLDLSWQLQRIGYSHGCDPNCGHRMPDDCPKRHVEFPAGFEHRQIEGGLYWTRPKSRAGTRVVPLVEPLNGILARWKAMAPANPWGLVFTRTNESGAQIPLDPDYISRLWPGALEAAGITKKLRLHDCRHTAVDLLYAAGVNESDIASIVGHSSVTMSRQYKSPASIARVTTAMKQLSSSLGYEN